MTVRWGIVGPGGIAAQFAEGMRLDEGGRIVAVASRSTDRARQFADRFGIDRIYGSYVDLAADDGVDAVYVATPHAQHAELTVLLLDAGKHILCEKPLAVNAFQATTMIETARANDRFLMEAMWTRFLPAYTTLRDVLSDGTIGEPLVVEADFGFRMPVLREHRLFDPALGGGALLDLGIYPLQLCSLILGAPDAVQAVGHVGETGVDEQVAAVLHHAGGALGVVKAGIRVAMACTARISGSEGAIDVPAFMHCPDAITVNGKTIDARFDGEGLRFQVDEVHRCLAAGLVESAVMPWAESLQLAMTMDEIRRQIGVVYPAD